MNASSYMHSVLWCCTSCGYLLEGGQPQMECPICEAYKEAFIDTPGHVEEQVRTTFADATNSAEARARRLELLSNGGYLKKFRVRGRYTWAVHQPADSRRYT
jgi:hypothetical protein